MQSRSSRKCSSTVDRAASRFEGVPQGSKESGPRFNAHRVTKAHGAEAPPPSPRYIWQEAAQNPYSDAFLHAPAPNLKYTQRSWLLEHKNDYENPVKIPIRRYKGAIIDSHPKGYSLVPVHAINEAHNLQQLRCLEEAIQKGASLSHLSQLPPISAMPPPYPRRVTLGEVHNYPDIPPHRGHVSTPMLPHHKHSDRDTAAPTRSCLKAADSSLYSVRPRVSPRVHFQLEKVKGLEDVPAYNVITNEHARTVPNLTDEFFYDDEVIRVDPFIELKKQRKQRETKSNTSQSCVSSTTVHKPEPRRNKMKCPKRQRSSSHSSSDTRKSKDKVTTVKGKENLKKRRVHNRRKKSASESASSSSRGTISKLKTHRRVRSAVSKQVHPQASSRNVKKKSSARIANRSEVPMKVTYRRADLRKSDSESSQGDLLDTDTRTESQPDDPSQATSKNLSSKWNDTESTSSEEFLYRKRCMKVSSIYDTATCDSIRKGKCPLSDSWRNDGLTTAPHVNILDNTDQEFRRISSYFENHANSPSGTRCMYSRDRGSHIETETKFKHIRAAPIHSASADCVKKKSDRHARESRYVKRLKPEGKPHQKRSKSPSAPPEKVVQIKSKTKVNEDKPPLKPRKQKSKPKTTENKSESISNTNSKRQLPQKMNVQRPHESLGTIYNLNRMFYKEGQLRPIDRRMLHPLFDVATKQYRPPNNTALRAEERKFSKKVNIIQQLQLQRQLKKTTEPGRKRTSTLPINAPHNKSTSPARRPWK